MTGSSIPRLASEVSVSLIGKGSYLPERRVSNQEILRHLRPARPDGRTHDAAGVAVAQSLVPTAVRDCVSRLLTGL